MAEIKHMQIVTVPQMKFVGKRYTEADKVNGFFSYLWEKWFVNKWFDPLTAEADGPDPIDECPSYYGLCRCAEDGSFEYWIGVLLPLTAKVPQGYDSVTVEGGELADFFVYGKEPDIYTVCCLSRLKEEGYAWAADSTAHSIMLERYANPRFTEPDSAGNRILDLCYFVEKIAD